MEKSIYVAATSQHVGKTTMTLGLLAALKKRKENVGYSKPLGQQYLDVNGKRVDKDAVLFADCMNFDLDPDIHSPVILGPGDTAEYIDNPKPGFFVKKILRASDVLHKRHEIVVYEGTGHPGVGSVVDLSNAEVAHQLNSDVILVLEGGIGNTLDRLSLCKSVFDQKGVNIIGVIPFRQFCLTPFGPQWNRWLVFPIWFVGGLNAQIIFLLDFWNIFHVFLFSFGFLDGLFLSFFFFFHISAPYEF